MGDAIALLSQAPPVAIQPQSSCPDISLLMPRQNPKDFSIATKPHANTAALSAFDLKLHTYQNILLTFKDTYYKSPVKHKFSSALHFHERVQKFDQLSLLLALHAVERMFFSATLSSQQGVRC